MEPQNILNFFLKILVYQNIVVSLHCKSYTHGNRRDYTNEPLLDQNWDKLPF